MAEKYWSEIDGITDKDNVGLEVFEEIAGIRTLRKVANVLELINVEQNIDESNTENPVSGSAVYDESNSIKDDLGGEYYNKDTTTNYIRKSDGSVATNGTDVNITDFIDVTSADELQILGRNTSSTSICSFYDEDYVFISSYVGTESDDNIKATIASSSFPIGTVYVRSTAKDSQYSYVHIVGVDIKLVSEETKELSTRVDYIESDSLAVSDDLPISAFWWGLDGATAISYTSETVGLRGIRIPVIEGQVIDVFTSGGTSSGRAWGTSDSGGTMIRVSAASLDTLTSGVKVTIASGESFLYVNCTYALTDNADAFGVYLTTSFGYFDKLLSDIANTNQLYGKGYKAIGSSTTENWTPYYGERGSYAQRVADANNMTFTNLGLSGYALSYNTEGGNYFIDDILGWDSSFFDGIDYFTFLIGANDVSKASITYDAEAPLYTIGSGLTDFCGALKAALDHIATIAPNAKVGVIMPFVVNNSTAFKALRAGTIAVCEKYSTPCLDINDIGFGGLFVNTDETEYSAASMTARKAELTNGDDTHLNSNGMDKLKTLVDGFMSTL